jgi:hypothetical protein
MEENSYHWELEEDFIDEIKYISGKLNKLESSKLKISPLPNTFLKK